MDVSSGAKQTIIISLVVALLAFLGGYFLGQSKFNFSQGNKFQNKPISSSGSNVKINSLSGIVKSINANRIALKINESDERLAEIDGQTKIYIQEQKDPSQYQKEMDEYIKRTQEQAARPKPGEISTAPIVSNLSPEIFTKKPGSLNDIKSGNTITVVANENIKEAKQFKIAQIIIPPPPVSSTSIPPIVPLSNQ